MKNPERIAVMVVLVGLATGGFVILMDFLARGANLADYFGYYAVIAGLTALILLVPALVSPARFNTPRRWHETATSHAVGSMIVFGVASQTSLGVWAILAIVGGALVAGCCLVDKTRLPMTLGNISLTPSMFLCALMITARLSPGANIFSF